MRNTFKNIWWWSIAWGLTTSRASVPSESSLNSGLMMLHLNLPHLFNLFTWLDQLGMARVPKVYLPYVFLQIFTLCCYVTLIWVLLDISGLAYLIPHSTGLHSGVAPGTLGKEKACQSPDEPLLNSHTHTLCDRSEAHRAWRTVGTGTVCWSAKQYVELCTFRTNFHFYIRLFCFSNQLLKIMFTGYIKSALWKEESFNNQK